MSQVHFLTLPSNSYIRQFPCFPNPQLYSVKKPETWSDDKKPGHELLNFLEPHRAFYLWYLTHSQHRKKGGKFFFK